MPKTEAYDAQGEYLKTLRETAGPRNVPAHLMSRIRAASLNSLVGNVQSPEDSAMIAGVAGSLLQWESLSKFEKIERIASLELGEVRALLSIEDDNDTLNVLLNRKKEIEKQRKG